MAFQVSFKNCSDELQDFIQNLLSDWNTNQDIFEVKTSGSTGNPKTIFLSRKQLEASAIRSNNFFDLKEDAHVLLCMNPNTIGGKMVVIRALVGNYKLTVVPASGNPFSEINQTETFDFTSLVPFQLNRILLENSEKIELFKQILLGGMPLPVVQEQKLSQFNTRFYMGFGMTETVSHIALRKINESHYTCLPGVSIAVNKDQCLQLSDSVLGIQELQTTDLINLTSPTTFEWQGRKDFTINSGGIKIHPEALERELSELIQTPFILAGIPDSRLHEMCVLLVEEAISEKKWAEIQQTIETHFGKYAVPKKYFVTSILLRENGKIDRLSTLKQLKHDQK